MDKVTRFQPDSCSCVVDYRWDSDLPPEKITLTPVKIEPCPLHAPTLEASGLAVSFEEILAHNRQCAAERAAAQKADSPAGE